ncbi:inward rectifier potassium channel [Nitzschia inconspicua]|uniref:Inward rectifier potassium channel n=1 Tax=Nitzschia inconspicua TaxID=303405 RepID=A0A9K3KK47_9STRA|nr:inward rectifier potassium channel [Nitzschia inconspicua]
MVKTVSRQSNGGIASEEGSISNGRLKKIQSQRGPKRGLEWSLRSMHSIDTSAQHMLPSYFFEVTEPSESLIQEGEDSLEDQSAYEIFKDTATANEKESPNDSVWASLHAPLRHGVVDGKKVVFELRSNVTQRPKLSRKERVQRINTIINSNRSSWEVRFRFYLMHFSVGAMSLSFFAAFVATCVIFASLYYALEDGCCGNPDLSFAETFAFSVQTATTIGYGGLTPTGTWADFLTVIFSFVAILLNTIFAGLLFTKYVTPVINIQFSEVLTLCNVNGVPCLSFRIGNADGNENPLTDINVRLTYSYQIPYTDHKGAQKYFRQTETLNLLSSRQHGLKEVWTLRHVLDEASPLFGLNFEEHPANKIYVFTLSVDAVQEMTKSTVNVQEEYGLEDVMIGHAFASQMHFDEERKVNIWDFSKMSDTEPYPVWYPAKVGVYDTDKLPPLKSFGAF